jgi:hypothetical protein
MKSKMKNKKITKEKEHGRKTIALSQILILIIATIAFSWMVGGEVKTVSAADDGTENCRLATGSCMTSNSCSSLGGKVQPISDSECISPNICCIEGTGSGTSTTSSNGGGSGGSGFLGGIWGTVINTAVSSAASAVSTYIVNKALGKEVGQTIVEETTKEVAKEASKEVAKEAAKKGAKEAGKLARTLKRPFGQIFTNAALGAATAAIIIWAANKYSSQRNAGDITKIALVGLGVGIGTSVVWATIAQIQNMVISMAGGTLVGGPPAWLAAAVVIVATAIYMLVGYQVYSQEVFTFRPALWQPPTGGADCNKCNSFEIAGQGECSEYICHSYGLACDWVNDETEYETCVEVNKGDIAPSIITPATNIYGEIVFPDETNYNYTTYSSGAKINYNGANGGTGKCVPAYTPMTLAFTTNENSHCKLSLEPTNVTGNAADIFSNMKDLAEGNTYVLNHTLKLPSAVTADPASQKASGYELTNGGTFKFYLRCEDIRGNINRVDYVMQFCVQQGPDISPPKITGTIPATNSYIKYGNERIPFKVYTNEPADCRWDTRAGVPYSNMVYNFTRCSQNLNDRLEGFDFGCEGNLTGFVNGRDNNYYIACKDHPEWKGNATTEAKRNTARPEVIILKGTSRLMIRDVKINGKPNGTTVKSSSDYVNVILEVATAGGAEEGKARCMYSANGGIDYSLFSNEGSRDFLTTNMENLNMPEGDYKFFIQCYDIAENTNTTMINFSTRIDTLSPTVVRVFKDEQSSQLKLITDEVADCFYSTIDCNFIIEEGTMMESVNQKEHYIEWDPENNFYIKCKDEYGNYPGEGECSIIARPFEIVQAA